MDFIDQINNISNQVNKLKGTVLTEEATKTAFILPLLAALGYNVFDPTEVCPEYIAATPGLKGEKVDYAVIVNNEPAILIECKWCGDNLKHPKHGSQLYKYFNATSAKFGVLTNGIVYQFYTDIDKDNIMDETPFFEFDVTHFNDFSVNELKRFTKEVFNPYEMADAAINLLYTKEIKRIIGEQLIHPSDDFVKFFASQIHSGKVNAKVIKKFSELVKLSFKEHINDIIAQKVKKAIELPDNTDSSEAEAKDPNIISPLSEPEIITTQEELDAYYLIKAVLREDVDITRIRYKDTKSYLGINVDGSVRKTICRLWLNSKNKCVGILGVNNEETKHGISNLDEIYGFSQILKDRAMFLMHCDLERSQVLGQ